MAGNNSDVRLLLRSDTADGSTEFVDASAGGNGGLGHALVRGFSSIAHSTAEKKFGSSSVLYNEPAGYDLLYAEHHEDFAVGDGDFTIDFWARLGQSNFELYVCSHGVPAWEGLENSGWAISLNEDKLYFSYSTDGTDGTTEFISLNPVLTADTWYHVALWRSGDTVYAAVNGVIAGSFSLAGAIHDPQEKFQLFGYYYGEESEVFSGDTTAWVDEFRFSRVAQYSGDFSPPEEFYSIEMLGWFDASGDLGDFHGGCLVGSGVCGAGRLLALGGEASLVSVANGALLSLNGRATIERSLSNSFDLFHGLAGCAVLAPDGSGVLLNGLGGAAYLAPVASGVLLDGFVLGMRVNPCITAAGLLGRMAGAADVSPGQWVGTGALLGLAGRAVTMRGGFLQAGGVLLGFGGDSTAIGGHGLKGAGILLDLDGTVSVQGGGIVNLEMELIDLDGEMAFAYVPQPPIRLGNTRYGSDWRFVA